MTILIPLLLSFSVYAKQIVLYPGSSTQIPAPQGSVIVEKKGVISVTDLGRQLRLVAKKSGQTALRVGTTEHQVIVLKQNTYETYKKLMAWARERQGPQILIEDQKIFVRGEFLTYIDWTELNQYTSEGDDFTIQAKIDDPGKQKINEFLRQLSEKNNLPFSDLNTLPNWEISIANSQKDNLPVYRKIFSPYGIKINHSTFALTPLPMIEITILATEIRRSEMNRMGVEWPAATSFQVLPRMALDPNKLGVIAHHIDEKSWGKVLASPTLLTQSGETATFHSGGEIPIKTSNQFNASVVWKQYGIIMKIKPKADFTGKIDVEISCEVSGISESSVDGVPGLLINRISSHFNLSESKTIALSGLLREDWDKGRTGLPGFSDLPLFSQLFASENYRNRQTELVFFVTPRIVR